ncbi:DUF2188 domain-containing protein [Pseudomonas sp. TE24901]
MISYRIEKTSKGWAMFRARGSRPVIEADTRHELIVQAAQLLEGSNASVRIQGANGNFQELRF